ncbi:MAG: hypothetical protein KGN37_17380 [Burkholderiales bacterium]|nr:hypothetical protein [Burkholderiales bacterium]
MANKPFIPTKEQREQVRLLAGLGTRQSDLCLLLKNPNTGKPIDLDTLKKHFSAEIEEGTLEATSKVAQTLFNIATNPDGGKGAVAACIFWMKTRAQWRETNRTEITGADGEQLSVFINIK